MLKNRKKNIFLKMVVSTIVAIFIMMTSNYIYAEGKKIKIGDINGDGSINLTDLVFLLRHIAAEKSNKNEEWLLTEEQMKAGDIIQDEKVDSTDVLALLRYMAANKSTSIAEKHKDWLELEKTEEKEEEKEELPKETEIDEVGPKIEKIETISKAGDYKTGSEIQIKVTFDEKIYADKNKVALSSDTIPILNISFGEGEIKHPYVEENSKIETYINYKYRITEEDKGILKIDGAKAFDGTKTICDEAGNEVTLIAGRDLTGNVITANSTTITLDKKALTLDLSGTKTVKITATVNPSGTALTWTSSNNKVATIDGATGTVTALGVGETDIIVKTADGVTASCKVTVKKSEIEATGVKLNKTSLNLEVNNGEKLTVAVQPTNTTNQAVTWSSSNTSVATVNGEGLVTAKKEGTATITVKTVNGKTATCKVTVKNSVVEATGVKLNKTTLNLEENNGERLIATVQPTNTTNQAITWSSSNTIVAAVNAEGFVTAKKEGTATITAETTNGKKATCKVTVKNIVIKETGVKLNKTSLKLEENEGEKLVATIQPTNATNKTITWSSSNTNVATVNKEGFVTAKKEGTATITAKTANGKKATCKVTVKNPVIAVTNIKLDRTVLMLDKDHYNTADLSATVSPNNATDKTVTWTSSNKSVATVSNNGKIKALKAGTTTITAKTSNGKKAICKLTVIGQMKKTTAGNGVAGYGKASGWWEVKKVNWSKELVESYINNAEQLCATGDYQKYPEAAPVSKLPIFKATSQYTNSNGTHGVNGKTQYIAKSQGISANNYLILVTTTNQKIHMFQKKNGKWELIYSENTSTGRISNPNGKASWNSSNVDGNAHNRFDFYIGAMYKSYYGTDAIFQFWQCKRGGYRLEGTGGTYNGTIAQPYYAHRGIHTGNIYSNGAPSSAGCAHISTKLKNLIYKNEKMYGTRIIVY